jgi:hypothetical protein
MTDWLTYWQAWQTPHNWATVAPSPHYFLIFLRAPDVVQVDAAVGCSREEWILLNSKPHSGGVRTLAVVVGRIKLHLPAVRPAQQAPFPGTKFQLSLTSLHFLNTFNSPTWTSNTVFGTIHGEMSSVLQWSTLLPQGQEDATSKYRGPVTWPKSFKYSSTESAS